MCVYSLGADRLKEALQAMGLKSGGTVKERAQRLYLTKTTPLEQLDKKHFAKGVVLPGAQAGQGKTEADAKKAEEGALQVRRRSLRGEGSGGDRDETCFAV